MMNGLIWVGLAGFFIGVILSLLYGLWWTKQIDDGWRKSVEGWKDVSDMWKKAYLERATIDIEIMLDLIMRPPIR